MCTKGLLQKWRKHFAWLAGIVTWKISNCTNFIPNGFVNKESTFFVVILPTHLACVITNTYLFELFPIYNILSCQWQSIQ